MQVRHTLRRSRLLFISRNYVKNIHSPPSIHLRTEKFSRRIESSTGFSQLRLEGGGLASGSHNSVEDFLSLVASGDIPHQGKCTWRFPTGIQLLLWPNNTFHLLYPPLDPNMLQVPLQKVLIQQADIVSKGGYKRKLSQHQLVALASRLGSSASLTDITYASSAVKKRKNKWAATWIFELIGQDYWRTRRLREIAASTISWKVSHIYSSQNVWRCQININAKST
jgi:hypothetical protein